MLRSCLATPGGSCVCVKKTGKYSPRVCMVNVLLGNTSLEKWINVEHCKGRWSFKCFPNSRISSSVSQFSQVSLKISPFPSFPARSFVESLFYWQSLECMVNIQEWIKTQFQDRILFCIWYEVINQAKDV